MEEHTTPVLGSQDEMPVPSRRTDIPLKLWVILARAFDAVDHHSRASIARFGLGTTEFGVLEVLYHKGRLPVCEVQRRILVESSSTTYVVDKLVQRGLVRRRPSGRDRRVVLLALTPAGRRLVARIFPPHASAIRRAVASLPARQQAQAVGLLRALGKGAAALDARASGTSPPTRRRARSASSR
jgi:MarR family 2-MHQ and catechol resistance regulon transcriptional repressor